MEVDAARLQHRSGEQRRLAMTFGRLLRVLVPVLSGSVLAACAQGVGPQAATGYGMPQGAYAHRVASSNLELYWNCTSPAPGIVDVEGIVHNTSSGDVHFVDLDLVGVGSQGVVSEAKASVQPVVLSLNETAPFLLRAQGGGPETQFDLYYQYRRGVRPGALFPDDARRFSARNICSPSSLVAR
jgi:hypothetical protein